MYDYVINSSNPEPLVCLEEDLSVDNFYVRYAPAPYLGLPSSEEEFRSSHRRKFWYNIRRNVKKFQASYGPLSFRVLRCSEELDVYLDKVFVLFNQRWDKEYTSSAWKTEQGFAQYKTSMISLSKKGQGFLAVLTDQHGELLTYGYCLESGETVHFYQHSTTTNEAYRQFSLGKILVYELLCYSIREGYTEFDFMCGDSPYKFEWTKNFRQTYVNIGKRSPKSLLYLIVWKIRCWFQFNQFLRPILKRVFLFLG